MDRKELEKRTRRFHVDVIRLSGQLPRNAAGFETGKQIIRSAGSVGANYRASRRAKSTADFIYKIEVVLEESDETLYWMEVIRESELVTGTGIDALIGEANQLTAIFAASCKSAKQNAEEKNALRKRNRS